MAIWGYIAQTTIIETHKTRNICMIHTPDVHTMPEMKPVTTLSSMHRQITCVHSEPFCLIYDGCLYNPIIHARSMPIRPVNDMPQWTPHHLHRREQGIDQKQQLRLQMRQNPPTCIPIVIMKKTS